MFIKTSIKFGRTRLHIGRVRFDASRWPWQRRASSGFLCDPATEGVGAKYGWRGTPGMGRFGGGWNWCLGFRAGGSSITLELLFGMITINWFPEKPNAR